MKKRLEEVNNKLNDIKYHRIVYCKNCGKEINQGTKNQLCFECYSKTCKKVERPDRETLKFEIRNMPLKQVAEKYMVTDGAVRKWCDKYNLPRSKKLIYSYSDEEWSKF